MSCELERLAYKLALYEVTADWDAIALTAIAMAVIAVACAIALKVSNGR